MKKTNTTAIELKEEPVSNSLMKELSKTTNKLSSKIKKETATKKATAKKTTKVAKTTKEPTTTVSTKVNKKHPNQSTMFQFPKYIENDEIGVYKLLPNNRISSMKSLNKAYDEERQLLFAYVWTPAQIKNYEYAKTRGVKCPKEFEYDLDLLQLVYSCELVDKAYLISFITEALFEINEQCLKTRNAFDIPFAIYEKLAD